jgi:hypothetical protein
MALLNQVIAVEKGIKSRVYSEISDLHKVIQKPDLFNGFVKSYKRKNEEDGEELPSERKQVQYRVPEVMQKVARDSTEIFNITARKDWTNCDARADVAVDGVVLLPKVPVTHLLFLEKQLTDMRTFVGCLPVLDEAESWTLDPNSGLFKTEGSTTHRTKKVQKPIVLIQPTVEHPGQAELITEDVIVGFWTQLKQSGAMPKPDRDALAGRVEKLLQAVKMAREAANSVEESASPPVGEAVFGYLLG